MAIVQISQITNRKGLAENLPQLAGAELGWSTDTRQLWIGNGTLEEGAPVVGNTEILTEFSDILNLSTTYTYEGLAAGYLAQTGSTSGTPIKLSLQNWFDQWASVLDFGAVGDGITDCTAAINRALYQLFCRQANTQIRRSLFFPAGTYRVTGTINIPAYATLYGEGIDGSVIVMDASINTYVARTADSLQQTGDAIGTGGATPPQSITITNMGFQSQNASTDVFYVQDAVNCRFQNVGFAGPGTTSTLTSAAANTRCIRFNSTSSLICDQIVFDGCRFSGTTWATETNRQIQGVVFSNSLLKTLYRGVELGTGTVINGGASGVRIVHNQFDSIYSQGIIFGAVSLNASGHNVFYDVGNQFLGSGHPASTIIEIQANNNISVGDMFARNDVDAVVFPRININGTQSIATTNGEQTQTGTQVQQSGVKGTLINNSSGTIFSIPTTNIAGLRVDYTIVRGATSRTGTIMVTTGTLVWSDDFVSTADTGVVLGFGQDGSTLSMNYSAANTGVNGTISYTVSYLY